MDYYQIPAEQLGQDARIPIQKLGNSGEVFYELALEMIRTIEENNALKKHTVMICPVGPVGQYPIFVRLVNERKISLHDTTFINMDEYLTDTGEWIAKDAKLSFRGFMDRNVYQRIDASLVMPASQRVFPDPLDLEHAARLIEAQGGVDLAVGGIGINGHLAFNEPIPSMPVAQLSRLSTRVLAIAPETRTANAIGDLGGSLERMPKSAVTIGLREILSARKLRLGVFREWHRAVIRRAIYGEVSAEFPVTLAQNHSDAKILVNDIAAGIPF